MKGIRKPSMIVALVVVLVGGAAFLLLPTLIGAGYPIAKADHISSWSWQGVYKDGGTQEAGVKKEITLLKQNKEKALDTYDLYVGIASQYELLGDGKSSYRYLSKAIELDKKRGLAYMNLGHLMEELGAFATARNAYDAAVAAEPGNPLYETAREGFLTRNP